MVTGDDDDATPPGQAAPGRPRLQAVRGPLAAAEPRPPVRLWREFKGLTVADLLRDEVAMRLPGQVRSALHHLERGALDRAEAALPGEFPPVLQGPGATRRRDRLIAVLVALAAVAAAATLASWFHA